MAAQLATYLAALILIWYLDRGVRKAEGATIGAV
jgi:hypothetical protein